MIHRPIDSITIEDIRSLKDNAVPEGKTIEYKRDLHGGSDDEKRKFLREVCSFANTSGGDLIYGIEARDGVPASLAGIARANEDEIKLRLENACRDTIEPRPSHLQFKFIPIDGESSVLVVRVAKSWNPPHRLKQDGHFYARNSAGCHPMDVGEIRQAFILAESVGERIRAFRANRLIRLEANEGPVGLADGVVMAFHMVPLSAFSAVPPQRIELTDCQHWAFDPWGSGSVTGGINLDGYYRYSGRTDDQAMTYAQCFWNASVELVTSFPVSAERGRVIHGRSFVADLVRLTTKYRDTLSAVGVTAPFIFFLSFLKVHGVSLIGPSQFIPQTSALNMRNSDVLILPEAVTEREGFDVGATLRPLFDSLWNAFGQARCPYYDANGALVTQTR